MRSMKTLLRLLGAVSLSTVAASSVVACGPNTKATELNGKYATLLGWYDADNKTSKITQKLEKVEIPNKEKFYFKAIIPKTNFKNYLLTEGTAPNTGRFKAKDADAAAFLKDLGFTSGSTSAFYKAAEVTSINDLIYKVTSTTHGKIEKNGTSDFKVDDGTCQVDIMDNSGNDIKFYTIKMIKNDRLDVHTLLSAIVEKNNLALTAANNFKKNGKVLTSLPWADRKTKEKNLYNSLVKLMGNQKLVWTTDAGTVISKYPNNSTDDVSLKVMFGEVKVANFNVGKMPA